MRSLVRSLVRSILLAAAATLAGCVAAGPDDRDRPARGATDTSTLSCAELAELRASQQHEAESAPLDERDDGLFQDSGLLRDFVAIDAAARRRAVEEHCERLRGQPTAGTPAVTIDR